MSRPTLGAPTDTGAQPGEVDSETRTFRVCWRYAKRPRKVADYWRLWKEYTNADEAEQVTLAINAETGTFRREAVLEVVRTTISRVTIFKAENAPEAPHAAS